jgi:hypothetical protein
MDDVQEAVQLEQILRALPADATEEDVIQATRDYRRSAVSAAMIGIRYTGSGAGGASSLTGLDDVSGTPGPNKAPVGDDTGTNFTLLPVVTQQDLDAILASVAEVDWRPLDLQAGFVPYGNGFADPRYRLTLNNVVHAEGMVGCNPPLSEDDTGKLVATFATDALPSGRLLFGCPAFGNNARFDVDPDGKITFEGMLMGGGQIDWFSLTPINYSVGAATP